MNKKSKRYYIKSSFARWRSPHDWKMVHLKKARAKIAKLSRRANR